MEHLDSKPDAWEPLSNRMAHLGPMEADGPEQAGHKKSSTAWSPEIANRNAKSWELAVANGGCFPEQATLHPEGETGR